MNRTKIDWPDLAYTWNPVVGCKTGCWYCYAKQINERFGIIDNWNEPQFFIKRLIEPARIKKPSKIFVCSMADLFGYWIPSIWILQILEVISEYNQHEYMFLTKYPLRYKDFNFTENCWLGTTIEQAEYAWRLYDLIKYNNSKVKKYVSIEPLTGDFEDINLTYFDLIIVGAMTGNFAIKPERGWIESIKHRNIYFKNNIKEYL